MSKELESPATMLATGLDSPRDQNLRDLVLHAAYALDAPISLLSELDDTKQTFLAEVGIGLTETDLEESFCRYTVRGCEIFEVPDTLADPRFASLSLVTGEQGIRFYAGAPIRSADGVTRGAFCILDTKTRRLTDRERRTLEFLASQAELRLQMLARIDELDESRRCSERAEKLLRSEQNKLLDLVKDAPAFVAMLEGPDLRFTYANSATDWIVGKRDLVGLPILSALPEVGGQEYVELLEAVMSSGRPLSRKESSIWLRDSEDGPLVEHFLDFIFQPARNADGVITGVLVHGSEVTDQVLARRRVDALNAELEERVQRRTEELVFKNQELERFTYAVSHDMRAPLRAIIANAAVVLAEESSLISEQGQWLLSRLSAAALRMSLLVDDLLQYARLGRTEIQRETIRLRDLAEEVAQGIFPGFDRCALENLIPGELEIACDPRLVGMALQNLFENGCKYARADVPATVSVGAETHDGELVFVVRDNGIGFDMNFVEKLFKPFERLHREEYSGTGIGLANVKRAIERHGGRVWAQSHGDGTGAAFFFTLGANE